MRIRRPLLAKTLVSVFVIINLLAVAYANRPVVLANRFDARVDSSLSAWTAYRLRYLVWLLARYGHFAGLDNRWQMFGYQSRFNWWMQFEAVTADGQRVLLPLPNQSQRSFSQHHLFDFREAKYHLNLYGSPDLRERYARYLCRAFPTLGNSQTSAVRITLFHQMLVEPEVARRRRNHLEPETGAQELLLQPCSSRN